MSKPSRPSFESIGLVAIVALVVAYGAWRAHRIFGSDSNINVAQWNKTNRLQARAWRTPPCWSR
jgi:hypothetical protein